MYRQNYRQFDPAFIDGRHRARKQEPQRSLGLLLVDDSFRIINYIVVRH
ncbi:Uncharacterized protein pbN1_40760 [Aromatoleum bremense]|nr:Uncharacterized protein pbN1_40760 [Aromatoleum bremense]